jgi:hypothetical protein
MTKRRAYTIKSADGSSGGSLIAATQQLIAALPEPEGAPKRQRYQR